MNTHPTAFLFWYCFLFVTFFKFQLYKISLFAIFCRDTEHQTRKECFKEEPLTGEFWEINFSQNIFVELVTSTVFAWIRIGKDLEWRPEKGCGCFLYLFSIWWWWLLGWCLPDDYDGMTLLSPQQPFPCMLRTFCFVPISWNILKKKETTSVLSKRQRSGRPRKTTAGDDRKIIRAVKKTPKTTVSHITNNLQSAGVKVSQYTIHRRLRQQNNKGYTARCKHRKMQTSHSRKHCKRVYQHQK